MTVAGTGGTNAQWSANNLYVGGSSTSAGGSGELNVLDGGQVIVSGTLKNWSSGTVKVDGGLLKTRTLNIAEGDFNLVDGRVEAVNIVGDLTIDGGVYAPGNSPAISSISGDFTQGAGNTLEIELAGILAGEYDVLNVGGTATLGGVLDVVLLNDFVANFGDVFTILTADTIEGTFSEIFLPTLAGGYFDVVYGDTFINLEAVSNSASVPEPTMALLFPVALIALTTTRRRSQRH